MSQTEILNAIRALTPDERIELITTILQMTREDLHSSSKHSLHDQMVAAAALMRDEYERDSGLTIFTRIG